MNATTKIKRKKITTSKLTNRIIYAIIRIRGIKMKKIINLIFVMLLIVPVVCLSAPGDNFSNPVSYSGVNTISSSSTFESKTYSSSTGGQNALLVSGGISTLNSCTINKTGNSSDENSDFYGTNAAILVYNGATLNINSGTVTTNGSHANAIFAYGSGIIRITNTTIKTLNNNSGGLMVTGGGILKASNLNVETSGNSSAAIRSDRGGGTLTITGGSYSTSGVGSPAIYSTADITVTDASLVSTSSEGVIVEGANSITLNNVKLTDTNKTLNGNSETYKNIFLYQSMSGDAKEGKASFTAEDSTITTNKGDSIFVTNTTAKINLINNIFVNNSGDFLRIQKSKWGNSGSNGGNVTLNMTNQKATGNIIVDSISTLDMTINEASVFDGSIDSTNQALKVALKLSGDSVFVLTSNSYVDSLTNEIADNSNIYLNGHSLYVNGKKVSGNTGTYEESEGIDTNTNTDTNSDSSKNETVDTVNNNNTILYIAGGVACLLIIGTVIIIITIKNKKTKEHNAISGSK